jgi:hypothetical protein
MQTNPVYLNTGGIAYLGSPSPLNPASNGFAAVDPNFGTELRQRHCGGD